MTKSFRASRFSTRSFEVSWGVWTFKNNKRPKYFRKISGIFPDPSQAISMASLKSTVKSNSQRAAPKKKGQIQNGFLKPRPPSRTQTRKGLDSNNKIRWVKKAANSRNYQFGAAEKRGFRSSKAFCFKRLQILEVEILKHMVSEVSRAHQTPNSQNWDSRKTRAWNFKGLFFFTSPKATNHRRLSEQQKKSKRAFELSKGCFSFLLSRFFV